MEISKNAIVYEGTEYHAYFKYSDAMILDSGSFIAEYLYVNKPQLFLRRPEQGFNELGEVLRPLLYEVDGEDIDGIEQFVKDVVIQGKDDRQKLREQVLTEFLDYRNICGKEQSAAENIFEVLMQLFGC